MKPWSSDGEGGRVSREHYRCYYKRPEQWRGARYESPIESQCQVNAVVLVSDGEPTYKGNRAQWDAVLDVDFWKCDDISHIFPNEPEKYAATCGIDIARQMATTDQVTGIDESFVRTYTVGFDTGDSTQTYLEEIARVGFTPAAVDVDRADFAHDNRLFFAMFKPSASQSWIGNLKGYFLGPEGLTDIHGRTATTVQDGVRYMKPSAQSFWSGSADGDNVALGGASNRIPEFADRKIYTYLGSDPFDPEEGDIPAGGVRINDWNNAIDRWQSKLTDEKLDDPDDRDALLRWIKSAPMGDPLHSQPVQIDYGYRKMIYIMTNQGFLHAIRADKPEDIPAEGTTGDSSGGREMFAWMPAELLPNIKKHYAPEQSFDHIYGLDGDLVPWHVDKNEDGLVNGEDSLQLVMGMRRGGKHYYSLDVRDPWVVRLKWRIDGDSDSFPNLGETWSRPSLVTVNKGGVPTEVLVFGGGYDQDELDGTTSREESAGNAIYMADKNGNKIWSVDESDHPRMKYAIPSDLSVIDTDADGIVDRIYVGDLGGQVWRVDISDINSTPDVNVLADLNDGGHRTFFYPPSVSLHTGGNEDYLAVAIGSGNRTNPLREDSNDRIYMIKDTHIKEKMAASEPIITVNELYDATDNDIGDLEIIATAGI